MLLQLSDTARTILQLIAEGYTFEQLSGEYSAEQIQDAAREALEMDAAKRTTPTPTDKRVKTNIRTYEVWTEREDALLVDMVQNGTRMADISAELERHPMTVRRRMVKLGLS